MIRHHLKDGRVLNSITGYLVKKEDVPQAYEVIDLVNCEGDKHKDHEKIRPYSKT